MKLTDYNNVEDAIFEFCIDNGCEPLEVFYWQDRVLVKLRTEGRLDHYWAIEDRITDSDLSRFILERIRDSNLKMIIEL